MTYLSSRRGPVEIHAKDNRVKILSDPKIDIAKIEKDLEGVELNKMLKITRYFPKDYSFPEEHIHIIIQTPLPATTGRHLQWFTSQTRNSRYLTSYIFYLIRQEESGRFE